MSPEDKVADAASAGEYALLRSRFRWLPQTPKAQWRDLILLVDALTVNYVRRNR